MRPINNFEQWLARIESQAKVLRVEMLLAEAEHSLWRPMYLMGMSAVDAYSVAVELGAYANTTETKWEKTRRRTWLTAMHAHLSLKVYSNGNPYPLIRHATLWGRMYETGIPAASAVNRAINDGTLHQHVKRQGDVVPLTIKEPIMSDTNTTPLFDTGATASSAGNILAQGKHQIDSHASDRDVGTERTMARTVRAFNVMFGTGMSEAQGWQFMELLKMSRSVAGYKLDDFVDGAAYAALAGEARADEAASNGRADAV